MSTVDKKIHGGSSKKVKQASLKTKKRKTLDKDLYFNAIKGIKKD
jgi:hypothetical protein